MAAETFILSFRSAPVAGSVVDDARAYAFDPGRPDQHRRIEIRGLGAEAEGKNILFVVHGFNVGERSGRASAAAMREDLAGLPAPHRFGDDDMVIGVLWPGDWHIPVVNYSWEYADAEKSGALLAGVINQHFQRAASISMVSHSLGARVVLTAAARVARPLRMLSVTAAAADEDCLTRQYPDAVRNAEHVFVLRSKRDRVLQLAYPAGDFLSDIFGDDDSPFSGALGRNGPNPRPPANVASRKIPSEPHEPLFGKKRRMFSDFDHGDYFPSSKWPRPEAPRKSDAVSRYIAAAFAKQVPGWE